MECLLNDLEEAHDETDPKARRQALERVQKHFRVAAERRQTLAGYFETPEALCLPQHLKQAAPKKEIEKELL